MLPLSARPKETNGNEPWYALRTRYRHEKVVGELLTCQGFETFLPIYTVVHRWKDRTKKLSVPLFPNYVFLRGGTGHRLRILKTPGVCSIVEGGGRLGVIPDSEIAAIRQVVENSARIEPHPFLKRGDRVRVQSGPLAGLEGILVRKKEQLRVVVSIEVVGQSVAVEVGPAGEEVRRGAEAGQMRIRRPGSSTDTAWFEHLTSP